MNSYLVVKEEIKKAIEEGKAVVALESTIISHGMPYPQNAEMAKRCETIIREYGAIPATIAIMNGKIRVGLSEEELIELATAKNVAKVSRRDLAQILSEKRMGATTVATTMICAKLAGIKFFVTGGIGGIHRGYEQTLDVSADLEELAQTDVNVICAGAKSILDLPRTLEYLETKGVCVIGYQTDVLPQFFTAESEYKLNTRMDRIEDISALIHTKEELGLRGGVLITNPIPKEDSMEKSYIDALIDKAVREAEERGIKGKDVTPFLLAKIVEESHGESLKANIALVYHNAKVGAELASAYFKQYRNR